jgi:hypothetical protein
VIGSNGLRERFFDFNSRSTHAMLSVTMLDFLQ